MRTQPYIKSWSFTPSDKFTLSGSPVITAAGSTVRLRKVLAAAKLPGRESFGYPISGDVFVRTSSFAPTARTSWGFIEVDVRHLLDEDQVQVTSLSFRVYDGDAALYWDGGAWSTAGASDWNTLTEFNANLSAYAGASLAVEIKLATTDRRASPVLSCVKLKWEGESVRGVYEWVYGAVVASLKAGIRPLTDFVVTANGTAEIDLAGAFDDGLNVTGVTGVYDVTDDPGRTSDLFGSFAGGVITLTAAIPTGNNVYVTAAYAPAVAVTTSSDFSVDAEVPAIWVTAVAARRKQRGLGGVGPSVIDVTVTPPAGTVWPTPVPLVDLDFTLVAITGSSRDLTGLNEAVIGWMEAHPTLLSPALGERVRMSPGAALNWVTANNDVDDTRAALNAFSLLNVPLYPDALASAADGGSVPTGPVTAGDPGHPGIGYGVTRINLTYTDTTNGGRDTTEIT